MWEWIIEKILAWIEKRALRAQVIIDEDDEDEDDEDEDDEDDDFAV